MEWETRKMKIHRRSTIIEKKIFEPLQTKSHLDKMKLSILNNTKKSCSKVFNKNCNNSPQRFLKFPSRSINLPKLPFGKHLNYNNEDNFTEHLAKPDKISPISLYNKTKKIKTTKSRNISPFTPKGTQELSGSAGKLFIELDKFSFNNYMAQKIKYSPSQDSSPISSLPFFLL